MSADLLYSITLLVAISCVFLLFILLIFLIAASKKEHATNFNHLLKAGKLLISLAAGFLLSSIFIHLFGGHHPGSVDKMGVIEFLTEHSAFLFTTLAIFAGALWLKYIAASWTPKRFV